MAGGVEAESLARVRGSSRPGLSTTGIFITSAGSQSEFTPGELLGSSTPRLPVCGKKLTSIPSCRMKPRSKSSSGMPRVRPARMARMLAIAACTLPMFWWPRAWGRPVSWERATT